jgi:hypothetical protein
VTKLLELCDEQRYSERGDFELSLAECFKGMDVRALKGYTKEELMAFVEGKGGPDGLVPGWLEENQLWLPAWIREPCDHQKGQERRRQWQW